MDHAIDSALRQCHIDPQTRNYLLEVARRLISVHRTMIPKPTPYEIKGSMYNCFSLEGTIPVPFKNQNYNIPLKVIYFNGFPNVPPLLRVIPTSEMTVRQSEYVREDGVITLGILSPWNRSTDSLQIFDHVIRAFAHKMPLFRKTSKHVETHSMNKLPQKESSKPRDSNMLKRIENVYEKVISELNTEICELENEEKLIERKEAELSNFVNDPMGTEDRYTEEIADLNATIMNVEDWIETNREFDLESLNPEDLIEFSDLSNMQFMFYWSQEAACEDTAQVIQEAFNKGQVTGSELVKGLKEAYNQQFLLARRKDKLHL